MLASLAFFEVGGGAADNYLCHGNSLPEPEHNLHDQGGYQEAGGAGREGKRSESCV